MQNTLTTITSLEWKNIHEMRPEVGKKYLIFTPNGEIRIAKFHGKVPNVGFNTFALYGEGEKKILTVYNNIQQYVAYQ